MTEIKRPSIEEALNSPAEELGFDARAVLIAGDAVIPTDQMRYLIPLKKLDPSAAFDFVNWKDFTLPNKEKHPDFIATFGEFKSVEDIEANPAALAAALALEDNKWAKQKLAAQQSDQPQEQDVLILNSLTEEQMAGLESYAADFEKKNGKPLSDISTPEEVRDLFATLDKMGIRDRYRSDMDYCDTNMKARDTTHTGPTGQGFYGRTKDVRFATKQKNQDGTETMLIAYIKKKDGNVVINGNINNEWSLYQRADGKDIRTIIPCKTALLKAKAKIAEYQEKRELQEQEKKHKTSSFIRLANKNKGNSL